MTQAARQSSHAYLQERHEKDLDAHPPRARRLGSKDVTPEVWTADEPDIPRRRPVEPPAPLGDELAQSVFTLEVKLRVRNPVSLLATLPVAARGMVRRMSTSVVIVTEGSPRVNDALTPP